MQKHNEIDYWNMHKILGISIAQDVHAGAELTGPMGLGERLRPLYLIVSPHVPVDQMRTPDRDKL